MFQGFIPIIATMLFCTLAFSQGAKKNVAVLPTSLMSLMDENVKLSAGEQKVLTDRLQEKAVEALGGNSGFVIITQESIMSRIGTDNYEKVHCCVIPAQAGI
ncbi:hypothetical protein AGMMS49938_14480 [Fibrobacterales bacterium]|nr:hypothetical protein AGMMS49938_14480 [Fibrobacterales bacterium]